MTSHHRTAEEIARRRMRFTLATLFFVAAGGTAIACGSSSDEPGATDGGTAGDGTSAADATTSADDDGAARDDAGRDDEAAAPGPGDAGVDARADAADTRDPRRWPFSASSIWNVPIGDRATFVPAGLKRTGQTVVSVDEDIIVMHPEAPQVTIYDNALPDDQQWASGRALERCQTHEPLIPVLTNVPIPAGYVFQPRDGKDTANAGLAALRADGHTVVQTQPFSRCDLDGGLGQATTGRYANHDQDLFGPGIGGAHGGSGLSALGGALRLGELRPGPTGEIAPIRHALKLELDKPLHLFRCDTSFPNGGTCGGSVCNCRWPATQGERNPADGGTTNSAMRFGALLAIPSSVPPSALEQRLVTAPAKALAWTLRNYGAYIVDDTAWNDAYAFVVERGADGSFQQQFLSDWKFPFRSVDPGASDAWKNDVLLLVEALMVVDDNTASTVGGAGARLQPPAPPFQ